MAGGKAVRMRSEREVVAELFTDFCPDGFEVRFARAAADDKEIGEAGNLPQIEDADVGGFFVGGGPGGGQGDVFGVCSHAFW